MPTYKTTVQFVREITITARDASEANQKLEDSVSESEFGGDVKCDSFEVFEDEPVECPDCKGLGFIGDDEEDTKDCEKCHGEGSVPFKANDKVSGGDKHS
jgi:DnaJ-class molecular chaperone